MEFKFTAADFKGQGLVAPVEGDTFRMIAEIANKRLEEMLHQSPIFYCVLDVYGPQKLTRVQQDSSSHSVYAVGLKKLKEEGK